jgi:hypothetical protein
MGQQRVQRIGAAKVTGRDDNAEPNGPGATSRPVGLSATSRQVGESYERNGGDTGMPHPLKHLGQPSPDLVVNEVGEKVSRLDEHAATPQ